MSTSMAQQHLRGLTVKLQAILQAILTAEGQIATDTNEMLNSIAHSWQNLFHD